MIVYFVWEQAFKNFTAGYGAAAAYVLALALLVVGSWCACSAASAPSYEGSRR